jgi:hypothetical protein
VRTLHPDARARDPTERFSFTEPDDSGFLSSSALLLQPFMKTTLLTLLTAILFVAIANLLVSIGLFDGGGRETAVGHEYKVLSPEQMDDIGFRSVATEEGIAIGEDGKITFPKDKVEKIAKVNLLPRTILEVEKDGGWEFVAVTADNHYLFRRAK